MESPTQSNLIDLRSEVDLTSESKPVLHTPIPLAQLSSNEETFENPISFPIHLPSMEIQDFIHNSSERIWSGSFTFIHLADPQFGLIEKFYMEKENPKWDEEIRITTAAISQINGLIPKPKFVMICGDMLDTRPGTTEEQELRDEQYKDFIKTFQLLDPQIKIVVCAGNHDICDIATNEAIGIYHQQFGPDYFSFWVSGVKFSVLNSQYWKSIDTVPEHFQQHQNFMTTIPDSNAKHSVIFQHIPFFVSNPQEEDVSYLNIEKEHRFPVLDQLNEAGVKYIFCGHYHRNAQGLYKNIEQTVTSALCNPLGNDPCGFRIVKVEEDKITSIFVGIEWGEDVINSNFSQEVTEN